ncbi:unnamed protein product, partial [Rhizoctonia solani]
TKPSENDTVSIFLRKIPARVPEDQYLGSILMNPGAPGGSGVIGFDPRGVNMTLPPLRCYETEAQGMHSFQKQILLGLLRESSGPSELPSEISATLERIQAINIDTFFKGTNIAYQKNGNKQMLESLSVSLVVQDMEQIVHALGEDGLNFWG